MTRNKILSVEELWQFYNLSANLVCIEAGSGYYNNINPSFAQLLDFTEEELVSTPYLNLIHPDDREATSKKINELNAGDSVTSFHNRQQMKNGNYKWFSWTANLGKNGNIYAIALDCTDKIMGEEKLPREEITKRIINDDEKEWIEVARELRDHINRLVQKSPLYFNVQETDTQNSYPLLLHSSLSALNAITEIKNLSATLLNGLNKETKLIDNIKKLIEDTANVHPVKITLHAQNFFDESVSKALKLNIFNIVREQLNNILKHAHATAVAINLEQLNDKLFLSIEDNGVGFNKTKQKNGMGILNIISCAEQYNGKVFIDTAPGKGCTLSVSFTEQALILN